MAQPLSSLRVPMPCSVGSNHNALPADPGPHQARPSLWHWHRGSLCPDLRMANSFTCTSWLRSHLLNKNPLAMQPALPCSPTILPIPRLHFFFFSLRTAKSILFLFSIYQSVSNLQCYLLLYCVHRLLSIASFREAGSVCFLDDSPVPGTQDSRCVC